MILKVSSSDRALDDVLNDLSDVELLTNRLSKVNVFYHTIDVFNCHGLYIEETGMFDRLIGFEARSIYIPLLSWGRLAEQLSGIGRENLGMRDVLRHEFGHAFATEHPSLIRRSAKFREIFLGHYDDPKLPLDYDPDFHPTEYAATNPGEDFAECFMLYAKYRGIPPLFSTSS